MQHFPLAAAAGAAALKNQTRTRILLNQYANPYELSSVLLIQGDTCVTVIHITHYIKNDYSLTTSK